MLALPYYAAAHGVAIDIDSRGYSALQYTLHGQDPETNRRASRFALTPKKESLGHSGLGPPEGGWKRANPPKSLFRTLPYAGPAWNPTNWPAFLSSLRWVWFPANWPAFLTPLRTRLLPCELACQLPDFEARRPRCAQGPCARVTALVRHRPYGVGSGLRPGPLGG